MMDWPQEDALSAYYDGVAAICQLSGRFSQQAWQAPTPCPEWRALDLAGHLRCVADDYNEYLDDAPASRLARLLANGPPAATLARKLARQNAAELAALPDVPAAEHIAAFASAARLYACRLVPVWELPHHRYQGLDVTVAGMAGAACAEWHLHAWDLARALDQDYRPAAPGAVLAGWRAWMPQLAAGVTVRDRDPWQALLIASGRSPGWGQIGHQPGRPAGGR